MAEHEQAPGQRMAIDPAAASGGAAKSVEGIDAPTSAVNSDSAVDTAPHPDLQALGGSEQGGMAGPIGQFEGEGNEGAVAPLGGDPPSRPPTARRTARAGWPPARRTESHSSPSHPMAAKAS